jgi:SAM-dependent methyltransferase
LLLRRPDLLGDVARIVAASLRTSIFANNSLISLLDGARARRTVPDAATGVGWYDERPFLDALKPLLPAAGRVLELGCGAGRISRHVAPLVAELVCTDCSRAMLAEARENLEAFTNVHFAATDGFALSEFPDGRFDVVFAQGVLGYLTPNQLLGLLDEVHRVLVDDGACVFNFQTIDDPERAHEQLVAAREMARRRRLHGGVDCAYTRGQIEALYRTAGLVVQPTTAPAAQAPGGRLVLTARRGPSH